ncbi:ATP-binding protein [Streptomyces sp. NBC_01304]|uniref:ATP-binding protein n=1 Tax=Streptomyces sp. NBC_01304 TaxID=2903818 RepID=UPI002E143847|nr:ATP-binding protein [Streptomyces sp. NBC_01304]
MPYDPASPRRARELTEAFLARPRRRTASVGDERADDAALVVSELVTNATRHGRSLCRLRLKVADDRVTVEVYDSNCALPRIGPLTEDGESGRGLAMVRSLAQHLDVTAAAAGGKTVRAVLAG